jgi:hypothetical protein
MTATADPDKSFDLLLYRAKIQGRSKRVHSLLVKVD